MLAEKRGCLEAVYLSLKKNVQGVGGENWGLIVFLFYS